MRWLLLWLLVGCRSEAAPVPTDTGIEEEEDGGALPALDPGKCGAVSGDEAPMVLDRAAPATLREKLFPFLTRIGAVSGLPRATRYTWTETEANAVADAVVPLVTPERVSAFNAHLTLDDAALTRKLLVNELLVATRAIDAFLGELSDAARTAATTVPEGVFFEPAVTVALRVLEAADRAQAAKYEPLVAGENAAAIAAIPAIDWSRYPFAADLIPGLGPTDLKTPLSEGGRQRCDLAIARFNARIAPLLIVSGGHVHPDRTPFAEAVEMKRYLIGKGVPASAILIDPHARHTTTNLRNASRLLLRHGVPPDRPVLITTDPFQSLYIIGRPFAVRCRDELGYEPWRKLTSLSIHDGCFFPSRISLTLDGRDPRDP